MTHATFRVHVDPDQCQGHNRCYAVSPDLFELDDLGMSSAAGDGLVPAELTSQARLAVANCPEHAISLTPAAAGGQKNPAAAGGQIDEVRP